MSYAERPAGSHLGVQNLGQCDAGMSKNFDGLLYPHLSNSLISNVEHGGLDCTQIENAFAPTEPLFTAMEPSQD